MPPLPEGSKARHVPRPEKRARPAEGPPDRTPPHNLEAETGLLCSCMIDGGRDTLTVCIDNKLTAEAFFPPSHQLVFQAMVELYKENVPVDPIVLAERLRRNGDLETVGGLAFLDRLSEAVDTPVGAQFWLEIVKEKYLLRRLIRMATQTVEKCFSQADSVDQFLEQVEQDIFLISQDRVVESAKHISESVEEASKQIANLIANRVAPYGVRTGLLDLDKITMGFHPGEMIVLAARPSVGKTSLAMNFAEAAICPPPSFHTQPAGTLVFSLEMSAGQLAMRMLTGRARVDSKNVRDGILASQEQIALGNAAKELKGAPLYIDDSGGLSILELRAKARRLSARLAGTAHPLKLVVVDYLQLIHGTDSRVPREQQIAEISRGLKAMAKELQVPVLVLSQLNRASEQEKRDPRLSDLRESGSIEQDADVVFLLHRKRPRDEGEGDSERTTYLPGDVDRIELIVAKQRNGPVGEITLTFRRTYTRFENYTPE